MGAAQQPLIASPAIDRGPIWTPDGSRVLFLSNRRGGFDLWAQEVDDRQARGAPELLRAGIDDVGGVTRDGSLYYSVYRTVFGIRTAAYEADRSLDANDYSLYTYIM